MRRAVVVGVVLLVASCGGSSDDEEDADVALVDASVTAAVRAGDNTFDPEELEVAAGTTVRFTNAGRNEHNVIPAEGVSDDITVDVEDLAPGATAERRLTEPGEYRYYCSIHGTETAGMIGSITVTAEGD